MALVESRDRRVPLHHQYREDYLIEMVRDLASKGDVPAIIFVFGREKCFEVARLLKSCRRFTTDEEKATHRGDVRRRTAARRRGRRAAAAARSHGIGIHHAGILPRYKRLVEELTLERLLKFVVCTETIAAGINLPAKTVIFPSLRKYVKRQPRAWWSRPSTTRCPGRAGRPQFDSEGLADRVWRPRRWSRRCARRSRTPGRRAIGSTRRRSARASYARARADAQRRGEVIWDDRVHQQLVQGEPAALSSRTQITAEQVLAIGLPDLAKEVLPGSAVTAQGAGDDDALASPPPVAPVREAEASLPAYMRLNIVTVVDNLLLSEGAKLQMHKLLAQVTDNLRAIGVIDEHGQQIAGEMIRKLHGMDGLFIVLRADERAARVRAVPRADRVPGRARHHPEAARPQGRGQAARVDPRASARAPQGQPAGELGGRRGGVRARVPARARLDIELMHQRFSATVPHPQLHGGKMYKNIWAQIEDGNLTFLDFVERHRLQHEEGSLFSYLIRVMNFAKNLSEATFMEQFTNIEQRVRSCLSMVEMRLT